MLVAGYFYLNNQVATTERAIPWRALEQAAKDGKISSAKIYQNREVSDGICCGRDIEGEGQKRVYVTDVKDAQEMLEGYDIEAQVQNVPQDNAFLTSLLPTLLMGALIIFLFMMMNRQMSGGGGNAKMMNFGKSRATNDAAG